jgi:hypothetical protein
MERIEPKPTLGVPRESCRAYNLSWSPKCKRDKAVGLPVGGTALPDDRRILSRWADRPSLNVYRRCLCRSHNAMPEMICGLRTDVQAPPATLPAFLFVTIRLSLGGDQVDGCEEGASITIADDCTLPVPAGRGGSRPWRNSSRSPADRHENRKDIILDGAETIDLDTLRCPKKQ